MASQVPRQHKPVFTHPKLRVVTACLIVLIVTTIMIPGMSTYLPFGVADQIGVPILFFPFLWTAFFIYCFIAEKVWHVWLLLTVLGISHGLLVYLNLS